MDVCAQWTSKLWAGQFNRLYTRRGLLHVTLCGHEGLRAYWRRRAEISLRRRPTARSWTETVVATLLAGGVEILSHKYTRRLNAFFFTFCLSIEWCWKPSVEKVDPNEAARTGMNMF